ncbi:MarP family serine protease [Streptomyces profundus]|uniref:MarP family serine protease n=1 Tax=Streptomyces profundus TaxID=2867410 RepID=UPI001D161756|nr:MarP family serine protease [Streptomyces sp. MA3_2.13]UED85512.1 MarP family serine protease [Streptomyces sp. MA3_2.13]
MNAVDVLLVLTAGCLAVVGYRRGLLVGLSSAIGFLAGALLVSLALTPLGPGDIGPAGALGAGLLALLAAVLGQALASRWAHGLRGRIAWSPARVADAAGGALAHVLTLLLIAWLLGSTLALTTPGAFGRELRSSRVLFGVSRAVPGAADSWVAGVRGLLAPSGLPQVFAPFGTAPATRVPPPDPAVAGERLVRTARRSVVSVTGVAPACGRALEGTGFVFANGKVMTNAHVVGGVVEPLVRIGGEGEPFFGEVVLYDPARDLAVLHVPGLPAPSLRFSARDAVSGDDAAIAGFPESGPFDVGPARVADRFSARGPDIYRDRAVSRDVYALHATVLPGNSGGPLLSPEGEVLGVVFARSLDDGSTGYALTADEVREVAARGHAAERPVNSGRCTPT